MCTSKLNMNLTFIAMCYLDLFNGIFKLSIVNFALKNIRTLLLKFPVYLFTTSSEYI